jgi:uncharacterized membrane protein
MAPLHPFVVHFPIVLLLAAAGLYVASLFTRKLQLDIVGFIFHALGLVACIVAIFTGDYEADTILAHPTIMAHIERHETTVTLATYGFGLLGIWALLRQKTRFMAERVAFVLLFVGLNAWIGFGAMLGGEMVFSHGVGVAPMQEQLRQDADTSHVHIDSPIAP